MGFLLFSIIHIFTFILSSQYVSTWFTSGVTIKKTIKHIGLTKHHQKTVEITLHMVNRCKQIEHENTGNNCTRHLG